MKMSIRTWMIHGCEWDDIDKDRVRRSCKEEPVYVVFNDERRAWCCPQHLGDMVEELGG